MPGDEGAVDGPEPSDAFQALGNDTRIGILRTLQERDATTFTSLFDASGVDTSAGFAYHLRQLDDLFVRSEDEEYELTSAGRAVARSIRSGTYTRSVDRAPSSLDERCPLCDAHALVLDISDNATDVRCGACNSAILDVSLPPNGYFTRDPNEVPGAADTYHQHRVRSFADGVCPDCAGAVTADVETAPPSPERDDRGARSGGDSPLASFDCEGCGCSLRCPVALTVLDHPAVVSFYYDHGVDATKRRRWSVGPEWRERVVSTDPTCVRVSTQLSEEVAEALHLYVAGDLSVVDHRREPVPEETGHLPGDEAAS